MTTYNTGNPIGSTEVKDLYDNAGNLDLALNDIENKTWTDRLGRERPTLATAIDPTGLVQDAADYVRDAENARDAALVNGSLYPDEATGRAAVVDGQAFTVQGSGDIAAVMYRRVSSESSVQIGTIASSEAVARNTNSLSITQYASGFSGVVPFSAGPSNATGVILLDWPVSKTGILSKMLINSAGAGLVVVGVYSKSGDTFTLLRQQSVTVESPGYHEIGLSLAVSAGNYVAISPSTGTLTYSSERSDGNGWRAGSSGASFTQVNVNTSTRIRVRFDVTVFTGHDQKIPTIESDIDRITEMTLTDTRDVTVNNLSPFATPTASLSANATFLLKNPASDSGSIIFECRASAAGTVKILLMEKISETRYEQKSVEEVTVVIGENSIPLNMRAESGDYFAIRGQVVGYRSETSIGTASFLTQNFVDPVSWVYNINILAGFRIRNRVAPGENGIGRPFSVNLPWEYMFLPAIGHSLIEGSSTNDNGQTPITVAQEFDNLAFPAYPAAPSMLLPATVANSQRTTYTGRGEWCGLGAASELRKSLEVQNNLLYTDIKSTIVIANDGVSGATIEQFSKGTDQYNAMMAQAAALANISGGTSGMLGVLLGAGENDIDATTYRQLLPILVRDMDADGRAQTGQVKSIPTVMYQMSTQQRAISLAQLEIAQSLPLLAIACPGYILDYYDNIHIDSQSERILGAYFAQAIKTIAINGDKWEPLWPVAHDVSGSTITITFNKTGLSLDTSIVPAQTNSGFAVAGNTVNSVSVLNGNQVRLQCASAPSLGSVISYGVTATGKGTFVGRAGNLRDNRGSTLSFDGFPLHNWCLEFDRSI